MALDYLELRREVFHILTGILFILIVLFIPYSNYLLFLVLLFGVLLSFISSHYKIPIISKFLCLFERECNKNFPGRGVLLFFIGSLLSIQLFDKQIALASIAILTFSDPISHFIGSNFGKVPSSLNKRKKVEGTIAGILAGMVFATFLVPIWLSFIGSLFAMILELIGVRMGGNEIDDNLLIPLVSGTIMHLFAIV